MLSVVSHSHVLVVAPFTMCTLASWAWFVSSAVIVCCQAAGWSVCVLVQLLRIRWRAMCGSVDTQQSLCLLQQFHQSAEKHSPHQCVHTSDLPRGLRQSTVEEPASLRGENFSVPCESGWRFGFASSHLSLCTRSDCWQPIFVFAAVGCARCGSSCCVQLCSALRC